MTETEKEKSAFYLWTGRMTSDWEKKTAPPAAHHHKPALNVGTAVEDGNAHQGFSLQLDIWTSGHFASPLLDIVTEKKTFKTHASLSYLIIKIINFKMSSHVF